MQTAKIPAETTAAAWQRIAEDRMAGVEMWKARAQRFEAALTKLDEMIVQWAKDEGFDPENSSCLRVVRAALKSE